MENLVKQLAFDTVKFVTHSEYISPISDELFDHDLDVQTGELKAIEFHSRRHTNLVPFHLYIKVNYQSHRMSIEFSSKILLADYPRLITADTFRLCLLNIERLGICKLDIDGVIGNCYFNKLHITRDIDMVLTTEILDRLNQHTGEYRRYKWQRYTEGIRFSKDVKAIDCRESIIFYNKEVELSRPVNKAFLTKTGVMDSILNYFQGKTRLEMQLNNKRKIEKELGIPNTDFHSVMSAQKNVLLAQFDKVFETDTPSHPDLMELKNIVDYGLWCTIRYHKFDLRSIEQEIKDLSLYSEKTKGAMGKQMKKIKAMMQSALNQRDETNYISLFRDKLKE